jgi:PAS domain S-box-containing protein
MTEVAEQPDNVPMTCPRAASLPQARSVGPQESQQWLSLIFNTVQAGIIVIDEETHTISDMNPAAARMAGRARDEIIGNVCHSVICPAEKGRCPISNLGQVLDNSERVLLAANGSRVPILKTVVRATIGGRAQLVESLVDISDVKRAQQSTHASEERYMLAVNGTNDGIWDWDIANQTYFLSPRWKSMIGYEDSELPNAFSTFEDHLHPDDKPRVMDHLQSYLKGEVTKYKVEFRLRHKDETYVWILARGQAIRDQNGVPYRMAGSHSDITDRKRVEELSRLSGMAEVATGVLHNVGNILNSVNVTATLLAGKIGELRIRNLVSLTELLEQHSGDLKEFINRDPRGQRVIPYLSKLGKHFEEERRSMLEYADALRGHVDHIKRIVATQQNYARVSALTEEISLPGLAEDALRMMQPAFDRHKVLIERKYEELPTMIVDKHSVLQILLNLLRNAIDAIKSGNNPDRAIWLRITRHENQRVRLAVTDSGAGVTPENLTRIFAHGFTTKKNGHGFGLHSGALAAKNMGGSLWAESAGLGMGATFILELPIAANFPDRC